MKNIINFLILLTTSFTISFQGFAVTPQDLSGTWTNNYGSKMELKYQGSEGIFKGIYSSTTGSTGKYNVFAWAFFGELPDTENFPIAISISWKSIEGTKPDPSWHWMSSLVGGYYKETGQLLLRHALVTTNAFPGISPGNVILPDKLTFIKISDQISEQTANLIAPDITQKLPPTDESSTLVFKSRYGNYTLKINTSPNYDAGFSLLPIAPRYLSGYYDSNADENVSFSGAGWNSDAMPIGVSGFYDKDGNMILNIFQTKIVKSYKEDYFSVQQIILNMVKQ